jgi:prolyl-tRNA editing enzyme YbaK/EbsC (Cys-tRNA(Pro) deacylase)
LPVYAETVIFELPKIYINGGKQDFLVSIARGQLREALTIREVEIAMA